jgi:hypothetical protein
MNISPGARTFLLLSITLAFHMFNAGFQLGAHGELFYSNKIAAWSLVTGALVALILLPRHETGVRFWQLAVLLIPSVWALSVSYFGMQHHGEILKPVLFILVLVSQLICLPYAIYILLNIINPDLLNLSGYRPKAGAILISGLFLGAGYFSGTYNYLFLSCRDFEVAGDMPPANCLVVKTNSES